MRDIRKDRHLSQEAFGNLLGLHRTYIGFIEHGERSPKAFTLLEITIALDMPFLELMQKILKEYKPQDNTTHGPDES